MMMMKSTTTTTTTTLLLLLLLAQLQTTVSLQSPRIDRRNFLVSPPAAAAAAAAAVLLSSSTPLVSNADDTNLASTLYNDDGSLRDDITKEAKEREVSFLWDIMEQGATYVDGKSSTSSSDSAGTAGTGTGTGTQVELTYKLPEKWISNDKGKYMDTSEGVNAKAAEHIIVYQAPGTVDPKQLQKASTIGVGKALQVISQLDRINGADLIGGRKRQSSSNNDNDNDQLYYEFDMASAPKTCDASSAQNLGLGFCPYDRIFLIAATVTAAGQLYVMTIDCDQLQWKQASADLKRVRSSFSVSSDVTATAAAATAATTTTTAV
eukprot:CAMPEP_0119008134 /NCGR_PEP_ID=MMETSP1176-20130426/3484_1 /TAXON_ID=265551 /ORGANISM="Synedropsis recta cf, Strain CCMP1620" /LENGTH=320 /DNA_ID=CAMNT_0006960405 /DNA_START=22 /DNA_END=984 /DNA_ORIENTATION=-